ncbi:MAG: cupin domain-containing protein [Reyranella sp.]|nr:cupin domain-containing protein [Reyranella sp.]
MTKPTLPAFDPADVAESNATGYPEPFREANSRRWFRRLGDHVGLTNFGVNLVRIVPGAQSSARHAHSKQDEFMMVISGELVLETDEGRQTLGPGMCAGFPAGGGNAHRFINQSDKDAVLLVVGDRTPGDEGTYPDIDLRAGIGSDGRYLFTRKDGTPH